LGAHIHAWTAIKVNQKAGGRREGGVYLQDIDVGNTTAEDAAKNLIIYYPTGG
jgi:hypothetical protein